MNSSDNNFPENEDTNQSNTESSNTQDNSNEPDNKNNESLFESLNFPSQSSDDDLMSLFANSGMLGENTDLFDNPEMMSLEGETTELFNTPEMPGETSEMDLFNTPEMMSMGAEPDLFATPEMMSMGEETNEMDLLAMPEMMSLEGETTELFNTPEMMSMGEEPDLFATPEMMSLGEETNEMDLLAMPEMMSLEGETTELFNTPEMMSMGGDTNEMDLFNTPEMMSMEDTTNLQATPDFATPSDDVNQFTEATAIDSELDSTQKPEMAEETNDMNLGLGLGLGAAAIAAVGASIPLIEEHLRVDANEQKGDTTELTNTPEMLGDTNDLQATPEMMSMSGDTNEMDLFNTPEMMSMEDTTNLQATPDFATPSDDVNQLTEATAIDSELDSTQKPEMAEDEPNDRNLGLGAAVGASIPLLEERLIVDISKQKIGEVVVRKEIEIEMIQVPVRREKLIVEQVGEETIQLAEIDLGHSQIQAVELGTNTVQAGTVSTLNEMIVSGEFTSAKIASLLLNAIALERRQGCKKIKIEIVVDDAERQQTYQEWVDRCSIKPSRN